MTDIRIGIYREHYTLAAFLDVSSAYDNVNYDILMDKLEEIECPKHIYKFIAKWMYERDTELIINGQEKVTKKVSKGLPQGAVLSPILYAIYTNNITSNLGENIRTVQFADDVAIYTTSRDRRRNKMELERSIEIVSSRLDKLGLELEPKKTVLVEFTKHSTYDREMSIRIKNTNIMNTREAKFLGIWLDNGLKFHKQVQEVKGKVNRANGIMMYLNKKSKGMEVNTALMLYKSLVRSVTDYGNFIYYPKEAAWELKFERTQFMGIRTSLGYRNSTPNNVLIAEAKVCLLRDRAGLLARNFLSKNMKYGDQELCNNLEELCMQENYARYRQPLHKRSLIGEAWLRIKWLKKQLGESEKYGVFQEDYNTITREIEIDIKTGEYRKETGSNDKKLIEEIRKKHNIVKQGTWIYTDGSRTKKGKATGASIIIQGDDMGYNMSLPKVCTSFTAEIFAIRTTLQLMEIQAKDREEDIIILTDSKATLQAIQNNHINVYKNRYVTEIRRRHFNLIDNLKKRLIYIWIPAHIGIEGNEMADMLAKEATEEKDEGLIQVPLRDFTKDFKMEMWNKTQEIIIREATYKGKFYFENFYNKKEKKPWFNRLNTERYFVTLLNRIRANHYNLNDSLARKNYVDSERCDCGYEVENIDHVLWQCSKHDEERITLDISLREKGIMGNIDIIKSIKEKDWLTLYCIYNYIKKIGKII